MGLVRMAARTAVVAGTATAVSGRVAHRQQGKWEQQAQQEAMQAQQAAPPPAAGGMSPDAVQQLQQLAQLKDQGILTEEEFAAQKAKILAG